jgi:hypothetical protein
MHRAASLRGGANIALLPSVLVAASLKGASSDKELGPVPVLSLERQSLIAQMSADSQRALFTPNDSGRIAPIFDPNDSGITKEPAILRQASILGLVRAPSGQNGKH